MKLAEVFKSVVPIGLYHILNDNDNNNIYTAVNPADFQVWAIKSGLSLTC